MKPVIVRQFEMKERRFFQDGKWQNVEMAAFVGLNAGPHGPELGIGLIKPNGALLFCGMADPYQLIAAWRGAQILDVVTDVERSMVGAALKLGVRREAPAHERYLAPFRKSVQDIERLRVNIMQRIVHDDWLEEMLKVCSDPAHSVELDVLELERELVLHIIHCTPEVRKIFDQAEAKGVHFEKLWVESCQALPEQGSFGVFCKRQGLQLLEVRQPNGDFLLIRWHLLDREIIYRKLRYGEEVEVYCAIPHHQGLRGHPVVRISNGSVWVIEKVFWDGIKMMAEFHASELWHNKRYRLMGRIGSIVTMNRMEPELVGVTFPDGLEVDEETARRGYISTETVWQKLKHWLRNRHKKH